MGGRSAPGLLPAREVDTAARARGPAQPHLPEVDLLERAIGYARMPLRAVSTVPGGSPTPCSQWTLRQLLGHLHESLRTLEEAGRWGRVLTAAPPDPVPHAGDTGEAADCLGRRIGSLLGIWTDAHGDDLVDVAGSPLRASVLAASGALEIAVHGWDLSRSATLQEPTLDQAIPDALAADLTAYLPLLIHPADRPALFSDPVPQPSSAGPGDNLLAVLGRDPSWTPWTPHGTAATN